MFLIDIIQTGKLGQQPIIHSVLKWDKYQQTLFSLEVLCQVLKCLNGDCSNFVPILNVHTGSFNISLKVIGLISNMLR